MMDEKIKKVMNKQCGNMYNWVTKTRNYLGGECKHKCTYCYVNNLKNKFPNIKERYSGEIRLLENELKKDEGKGKTIFVQNMGDLFADNVPKEFIIKVLEHLRKYPKNKYLFQTKNPIRFLEFIDYFPQNSIFGTTIETNRKNKLSKAPDSITRAMDLSNLHHKKKIVTLEPICDFDVNELVKMIKQISPEFVNIGADSKGHKLNEPSAEKMGQLIKELEKFTKVNLKPNLKRIYEIK